MQHIQKPSTFEVTELEPNKAEIVIGPLATGYGTTLGNALRRVMLSSLPGSAITSVKIKGVDHEFTAVEGIKEDVVQLILNLKQVRVISHTAEPVKLTLKKKGKGDVTSADFGKNADVEFVNTDHVIATVTDDKKELEVEVTVEQGVGYSPVESREEGDGELGKIAIDSIFTPIRNVNYEKENVRVGEHTNYDKLVMTIATDGTISPQQSISDAAAILVDQFTLLTTPEEIGKGEEAVEELTEETPALEEELLGDTEPEGEEEPKKRGRPKKDD